MNRFHLPESPETKQTFPADLLTGKVAFVTGGSSGICMNQTLSLMQHGANAFIIGRNLDKAQRAAGELSNQTGKKCIGHSCDVRNPHSVQEAVNAAINHFGRIDIVICGAAGNFLAPISAMSSNAFKAVIDIDLFGTYNTIKATIDHLRKSRGAYIHITATLHEKGTPLQVHVSAAKAGIEALSNVLAVEEGINGIRSNCIAPGPVRGTEGMQKLSFKGTTTEDSSPLGRWCTFSDINNLTLFLVSDAANILNGQVFRVDGGERHVQPTNDYPNNIINFQKMIDDGLIENRDASKQRQAKL
ncbi:Peroxisomal 2,4-dienoyl-CoA reductase SPS19 [Wallemia ichthyophaga EXF-994]|uniref:2,4-dienoyl-CoA reductase [(3E)-enoyl-CoA-producing] n=1 Tax=Wallemia ichthyophaga (strain EXF-994 / CBS 113033) TaxID=1299270 RepID=R9ABK6_WALI9|nr:Peroxisomal 2,4-dienoyl-CoA reductase SPS19 [Wallemia ichthyophaga EXF-994]EOQ99598.1 Peroxisomal 2,4-dienoyl-CoA reductase SPS19 [Wallemia ichthyophaga EXF-994]TIA80574.1 hypothetical protein E3P98_02613 [Wallemia ichthyophaga]TIA99164.1 hypothetical protein E3P95_02145 [Wallemia ichthyophaga]